MGRPKDAVEEYFQAANGNPADANAVLAYARSVLMLTLSSKAEERNWDDVDKVLDHAKLLHPNDGRIDMLKFNAELAQGKSQVADEPLDKLRKDPAEERGVLHSPGKFQGGQRRSRRRLQGPRHRPRKLGDARIKPDDDCSLRLASASLALRESRGADGRGN